MKQKFERDVPYRLASQQINIDLNDGVKANYPKFGAALKMSWSCDILVLQLKSNLYTRTRKAITNFSRTLPSPQSDLAQKKLKER